MAVSSTSIKGFSVHKRLYGECEGVQLLYIIDNSQKIQVGDAVRLDTAGYLKPCAATDPAVLGIASGLYDQNGDVGVFSPRMPATAVAGSTLLPDDTLTVSATNTSDGTRKLSAYVILDPAGSLLLRNVASGALAQANIGSLFNVVSNNPGQIDASSVSVTAGQFQLVALDPDGDGTTTKGIFRIVQNQLITNFVSYNGTAVITA